MYEQTSEAFARAYWHWFFLIQPNGLPQALIDADPVRYLHACMGSRRADGLAVFEPLAMAEYERCMARAGSGHGIAADYRASAGIDLLHDREDVALGRKLAQPLHVLWGERGVVGKCFDVLACWRERATKVSGKSLDCSHYIAEEMPGELLAETRTFFSQKI
jgi:haloacetate dehalogenase